VLSVTPDVTASATYQSAPPKPALPDPSKVTSSFASMIDDSLPADPQTTPPPAPEPATPPPPPRAAQNSPSKDKAPPRDTSSSDQSKPQRADNSSADDNQSVPPASASNTSPDDALRQSSDTKSASQKSGASKPGESKSGDKTSADDKPADALDAVVTAQAGSQGVTVPDPIAALIPVPAAPTNSPGITGNGNAPLAIAAAAIAAASATTNAMAGSAGEVKTADQTATPKTPGAETDVKTQAQAQAQPKGPATTVPGAQQIAGTDPTETADVAQTNLVGQQGATTAKSTATKTTAGFQGKTAVAVASGNAPAAKDAPTTVAPADQHNTAPPQPLAKPEVQVTAASAVKADADVSTPAQASHDHTNATPNLQPAPKVTDANTQLMALPQQQLSSAAPAAAPDKFTVTPATGAAVPVSGLAVEIAASAQSGRTHFEVRLDPADLGRIDVRIDVDRNGQVTSHLTVEKPETLSMLQHDAPQLQQALNDAGLKTDSGGLQFSLRDQSQFGQNNPNNNQTGAQPQRLVISEEDTVPAAIAGHSYGRMLGASGGVDIRV
jgi:flagellar hook-length control protein FliK